MHPPVVRTIDGHDWTVTLFLGRESLALGRQLMALAAEPAAEAIQKASEQVKDLDKVDLVKGLSLASSALWLIGKLAAKLDEKAFVELAERLIKFTQRDSKGIAFDADFQGELPTLIKVLAFIVEVNFMGPFANWLGPVVSSAWTTIKEAMEDETSTPATSSETKQTA